MWIKRLAGLPPFPKPAGTAKEFKDWDDMLREKYPYRMKLYDVLYKIRAIFFWRPHRMIKDAIWWVKYRIVPKHKYTTHKLTTLKPGYYDTDILMLHFMFEQFALFMEHQLSGKSWTRWEYTKDDFPFTDDPTEAQALADERNAIWAEMQDLYKWWTEDYPTREQSLPKYPDLPEEWGCMAPLNEDYENTPEMEEWKKVSKIHSEAESKWAEDEQNNLIRLIKIRKYLWD